MAEVASDRVVRVLPDEPAVAKTFDYVVPDKLGDHVGIGTRVRVQLGARRVGGWVVATKVSPPEGVTLKPLTRLSGHGPPRELIELAYWAAWRWAGRPASFLRTASPPRKVASLPTARPPVRSDRLRRFYGPVHELAETALSRGEAVLRLPPATDPAAAALVAAARGNALVLCPNMARVRSTVRELQRAGVQAVAYPEGWAVGAAGATVVGTRSAAWAPVGNLAAVVVVDEHDEAHAQEQAPTWHARDVAIERARRAGVACLLTSPCPSLEAQAWGPVVTPARADERSGWPVTQVVDRRGDDPRMGLLSAELVEVMRRAQGRVVCVLNRTGRARLLACAACGEIAACERCTAALAQPNPEVLACPRCEYQRPVLCASCGAMKLKTLRRGVSRVREELEALLGEPVGELTGISAGRRARKDLPAPDGVDDADRRVVVGTEAALHQVGEAEVVALLDLDQELLAPRYRAVEQAMGLVVRAARSVGGRAAGGRMVLQTRLADHEVVQAALHADPTKVSTAEAERRELLRFPPAAALAEVSGTAAGAFVDSLGNPLGVEVMGPSSKRWLLRATDHHALCDALAATPRPAGRIRVSVDPLRV